MPTVGLRGRMNFDPPFRVQALGPAEFNHLKARAPERFRAQIDRLAADQDISLNLQYEVQNAYTAIALASAGLGVALVPEIALTPQTVRRFAARFPGRVAVLHSALSEGERYDTWRRARQGRAATGLHLPDRSWRLPSRVRWPG